MQNASMPKFRKLFAALTAVLILSSSTTAFAQGSGLASFFSLLCVGEQSTGFKCERGRWLPARFTTGRYIVTKVDLEAASEIEKENCRPNYEEKKSNNGPSMLNACYNIRGDGGDHHGEFSRSCTEYWVGKRLDHIECDRPTKLFFQPNGNFIFSYLHPSLSDRPPGDY
jgi:hypothetical protein